ncbi:MAG TPA: hypothetical protein VFB39_15430 [Solirubrobacteraceae bacterium]|nr:hypothetical protein [Solirubrobacteraceae bacterium]
MSRSGSGTSPASCNRSFARFTAGASTRRRMLLGPCVFPLLVGKTSSFGPPRSSITSTSRSAGSTSTCRTPALVLDSLTVILSAWHARRRQHFTAFGTVREQVRPYFQ